jgi:hypothetical protein
MTDKPADPKKPIGDPPITHKPMKTDQPESMPPKEEETPPAGEGEAANDQGLEETDNGNEEETMPMEEGFSIVP